LSAVVRRLHSAQRSLGDQKGNTQSKYKLFVPNDAGPIAARISFHPFFPIEFDRVVVLYLHIPPHSAEQNLNWGPRPCLKVPPCKFKIGERRRKDFGAP